RFGGNGTFEALLRESAAAKLSRRISEKSCFLAPAAMNEFNDNEIARLLRLKRFEQPPAGYFENFLHEFHRRQRDELLRQPLWRICFERTRDFVFSFNLSTLTSYPAAVTAVLICAAVISLRVYQTPAPTVAVKDRQVLAVPANTDDEWTLASPVAT